MYDSFASQKEADRRAAICAVCPHNVFPDRGNFIRWADHMAVVSVGDRKSKHHDELGNCAVCTCPLRAKVFYTGKNTLTEEQKIEMRKVNCWQVVE